MIIIDANSICHAAKHSMGNLSWREKETGVIFGFLQQVLSLSRTMGTNEFIFTWDSHVSFRKEIYPDYKKSRKRELKTEDEQRLDDIAYSQFTELRTYVLPKIGFINNFMQEGFEADDLIAKIVQDHSENVEFFAIVSSDEDLYQLLRKNVYMYSTKKKQSYTINNLWNDYRISPADWAEVKAIGGCTTDCVPGIPGVGEKTAAKYLTRRLNVTSQAYKKIKDNSALIDFNRKLVKLPLAGTPELAFSRDDLCFENFLVICEQYGFRSFLDEKRRKEWKENIFYKEV